MIEKIIKALKWRSIKLLNNIGLVIKNGCFKIFKIEGKVQCNICGWKDFKFKSDNWHANTICPNCKSSVRQRLFVEIIKHSKDLNIADLISNKKILHFAPDNCLKEILYASSKEYKTADLLAEGYTYSHIDFNIDMTNMKAIGDSEFDCVIAFDVLEHIPDHLKAIQETHRILKKGGYCIFTIPQKDGLDKTFENLLISDPQKREQIFGQWDHWRIYGTDFKDMIENFGFKVTVCDKNTFDNQLVSKHVLYPPIISKHDLATNNRFIYFGEKI